MEGDEMEKERQGRKLKAGKLDREGKILVKFIEKRGWGIYNGMVRGNEEGEYTFTGRRGNTVIDYVIGDIEVRNRIKMVGDRINSVPPSGGNMVRE